MCVHDDYIGEAFFDITYTHKSTPHTTSEPQTPEALQKFRFINMGGEDAFSISGITKADSGIEI